MKKIGNFFARIGKFFREMKVELKKVIWPTWNQIKNNTGVVLICILLIGVGIWILDALFAWGIQSVIAK